MSASKFVIGGILVVAALVAIVPLFKRDFGSYSQLTPQSSDQPSVPTNKSPLTTSTGQGDVIGTYNGIVVKRADLNPQDKQSLFDAETQVYKAEESILAKKYFDSVLEKYAKDKKIADKNLAQQQYIQDHVKVSEAEVKAFIQQNSDNPQLKGKSSDEQVALVKPYLLQQAAGNFFRNVVAKAKADGLIKVTGTQLPESPRISIELGNSPSKGPTAAPITMVEFADYQCPYCYSVEPTVKSIMDKYKNKIRFVFKSYPLIQLHPQAVNASIAAECAQNQGKFWEMHDILFENHSKLSDAAYPGFAKTVGLDLNKFQACFKDPSVKAKVMKDESYGQSLGISATPAFYINGILLMGAQPESEFISIIEKELASRKN